MMGVISWLFLMKSNDVNSNLRSLNDAQNCSTLPAHTNGLIFDNEDNKLGIDRGRSCLSHGVMGLVGFECWVGVNTTTNTYKNVQFWLFHKSQHWSTLKFSTKPFTLDTQTNRKNDIIGITKLGNDRARPVLSDGGLGLVRFER